jgi:hypothetical protein
VNFSLNEAFIETVLKEENGKYQDLGTIFKNTKNGSLNGSLNRNFSLLGDPSMRLAIPKFKIVITSLKDADSNANLDTLKGLQRVIFEAVIMNLEDNTLIDDFSGTYHIELKDKYQLSETLGDESAAAKFKEESILLFKGSGSISGGLVKGELILPKNTKSDFGNGNLRIWGRRERDQAEAYGTLSPIIGGRLSSISNDNIGPEIKVKFGNAVGNQLTFSSTVVTMFAEFKDENGVNISNLNPQESMRIQVNNQEYQVVNSRYAALENSFTEGSIKLDLKGLNEGKNTVRIKAWDTLGNGSEYIQAIIVAGSRTLKILNYKTFPNPTSTESKFHIEHNRPGENILLTLSVYQTDGKILFTQNQRLIKTEYVINDLSWTFYQNQTKNPVKGTYIYSITLQSELDNSFDSVSGKIVIQ